MTPGNGLEKHTACESDRMRVLVIAERGITLDKSFIEQQVNTTVSINSEPTEDGVAIYTCGQPDPPVEWADSVILVGECSAELAKEPSARINREDDVLGTLVSMLQTLQDTEVEMADSE
jgi:hypothetical protein